MVHKGLLGLVMLFLVCSHVLSSVAVPATRSLLSNEENPSSAQDFLVQDAPDLNDGDELTDVGEGISEGRMDMESTDYPGTGANNHHDPRTPGRA
uniref:Uncharacterized protein MANES_09G136400 n=1 Tax=Rhizophora mucronata TaxID=61149 RepID=A0A2P2KYL1_RHIMU